MAERFRRISEEAESKGLADPFKGITADGSVVPGLFPIHSTGVSTEPVRHAAESLLNALSKEQRAKSMFPVDDPEWRKWMNQHFYVRQGVSVKEMNEAQRAAAFGLMQASLSARGMKLTRDIMRLNETLAELTNDSEFLGEWLYHITIMGKPSGPPTWPTSPPTRSGRLASTFTLWSARPTATITGRIFCGSTTCRMHTDDAPWGRSPTCQR